MCQAERCVRAVSPARRPIIQKPRTTNTTRGIATLFLVGNLWNPKEKSTRRSKEPIGKARAPASWCWRWWRGELGAEGDSAAVYLGGDPGLCPRPAGDADQPARPCRGGRSYAPFSMRVRTKRWAASRMASGTPRSLARNPRSRVLMEVIWVRAIAIGVFGLPTRPRRIA